MDPVDPRNSAVYRESAAPPAAALKALPAPWFPALLVAVVGVVSTVLLAAYQMQVERSAYLTGFERSAAERHASIQMAFELNLSHLMGVAALVAASEEVTRAEFQRFVTYERHGAEVARVMVYAPITPTGELSGLESRLAAEVPDYHVWTWTAEGERTRSAASDLHLPVVYAAPRWGNEAVLGFDLASEPARRRAIERALQQDAPAMTGPIRPIQAQQGPRAFSVVAPVYAGGAAPSDAEARTAAATGIVGATIHFSGLMNRALEGGAALAENLFLFTGEELHLTAEYVRLSPAPNNPIREGSAEAHTLSQVRADPHASIQAFGVGGENLYLACLPARSMALGAFANLLTLLIVIAGAVGTTLGTLYTLRRAHTVDLAVRHALIHDAMVNSSTDAYLSLDASGRVAEWSARAADLFGWPREAILGRDFSAAALPPGMRARLEQSMQRLREADAGGTSSEVEEYIAVNREGTSFPVELAFTAARFGAEWRYFAMVRDLSARQRAELERQHLRERADRVLAGISEGFMAFDAEWRFTYVNPRAAEWLGRDAAALAGRKLWEEFPDLSPDVRVAYYQAAADRQPVRVVEFDAGRGRWVERNVHPYEDGIAVFVQDITERKSFEEALRRSEERLRLALDAAQAGLWSWEPEGDVWTWSERFTAQLGTGKAPAGLSTWLGVAHPEDAARLGQVLQSNMARGVDGPQALEYRVVGESGTIRWLRLYGRATTNGHREVLGIQLDVTASHLEGAARREAEAMARVMFDNAQDGIVVVDCERGVIVDANAAFCGLVGAGLDVLRNQPAAGLHPERERERAWAVYRATEGTGGESIPLTLCDVVGAEIPVEAVFGAAQEHGGRRVVCGVFRDLTERRRTEEQLRHAYKMEAIGQLTGGLAHDFNNLLGVVIGHLDLIETCLGEDERARHWLEVAQGATLRGAALTKALLAVARRQSLDPEDVDVNGLLRGVMPLLKNTVGPTVEVVDLLQSDPVFARIDPSGLENAVLNLAINARDAMPEGGRLILTTARHEAHDEESLHEVRMAPGVYAMVEIADTGSGMDAATLKRAFEPFFTTKASGHGTGLGLAMVYGFAKQSGGHASIYSEPGHGTSIRLYLPWGASSPRREPSAEPVAAPARHGHEAVVMVDDEEALLGIGRMWLEKLGYRVAAFADPHAALAHIAEGGECDLLVTDVVMPMGLDGPALALAAREHRPGLPVLLTSGFAERSLRQDTALPGPLLQKPYRQGDLGRLVRQVLDTAQ